MSNKWFSNQIPIDKTLLLESPLKVQSELKIDEYMKSFKNNNFKNSANAIIELANSANLYLNDRAPWKLIKDIANNKIVASDIYSVLESCRIIAILLNPFVPNLSTRILDQLNINSSSINFQHSLHWGLLDPDNGLQDPIPVMDKIEFKENSI
tara:strand:- start:41 stop:499 length:459 start_codon:yes stop_codon:yes gene_type:complete